jgi:hypothetical protein
MVEKGGGSSVKKLTSREVTDVHRSSLTAPLLIPFSPSFQQQPKKLQEQNLFTIMPSETLTTGSSSKTNPKARF